MIRKALTWSLHKRFGRKTYEHKKLYCTQHRRGDVPGRVSPLGWISFEPRSHSLSDLSPTLQAGPRRHVDVPHREAPCRLEHDQQCRFHTSCRLSRGEIPEEA